jgi:hypothetical protein
VASAAIEAGAAIAWSAGGQAAKDEFLAHCRAMINAAAVTTYPPGRGPRTSPARPGSARHRGACRQAQKAQAAGTAPIVPGGGRPVSAAEAPDLIADPDAAEWAEDDLDEALAKIPPT